ncbi:MAG: hypothetical protein IAE97_03760 [Chthoniobacterales bacterium]|nr:hypothetical protein [Chthoniobacterales bacterium]
MRAVGLLVVAMLATGACCCWSLAATEAPRTGHSCCASDKAKPSHDHGSCDCGSRILAEAKSAPVTVTAGSAAPLHVLARGMDFTIPWRSHAQPARATAHAPPPREKQRALQVWLI